MIVAVRGQKAEEGDVATASVCCAVARIGRQPISPGIQGICRLVVGTDGKPPMSGWGNTLVVEHEVDDDGLADLCTPRDDVVAEQPLSGGVYGLSHGPFSHYERSLDINRGAGPAGHHRVTERFVWRLAIPVWRPLLTWPMRRALRQRPSDAPWWAPPDRLDARAARVLRLLACIQVVD